MEMDMDMDMDMDMGWVCRMFLLIKLSGVRCFPPVTAASRATAPRAPRVPPR